MQPVSQLERWPQWMHTFPSAQALSSWQPPVPEAAPGGAGEVGGVGAGLAVAASPSSGAEVGAGLDRPLIPAAVWSWVAAGSCDE